jgi:two-component system cell cycle response regulator
VLLVVSPRAELRAMVVRLVPPQIPVFEADGVEQARALLPVLPNGADCVILDAKSPESAVDVLKELRVALPPPAPPMLVLLDASTPEEGQARVIDAGAADAIAGPVGPGLLAAKIRGLSQRARRERELTWRLERALENATVDPLTGLFNRRQFERRLREESAHARRHRKAFALVVLDLDHFKSINDTYGHEVGDHVLSHVASILKATLREDDTAFRYGGEEFVLLLRSCNARAAKLVTDRVRAELAQRPLSLDGGAARPITFSAGVAAAEDGNEFVTAEIVARADAAMYRAKRGGRNRVEIEEGLDGVASVARPAT